jgi:hypothetical protein
MLNLFQHPMGQVCDLLSRRLSDWGFETSSIRLALKLINRLLLIILEC